MGRGRRQSFVMGLLSNQSKVSRATPSHLPLAALQQLGAAEPAPPRGIGRGVGVRVKDLESQGKEDDSLRLQLDSNGGEVGVTSADSFSRGGRENVDEGPVSIDDEGDDDDDDDDYDDDDDEEVDDEDPQLLANLWTEEDITAIFDQIVPSEHLGAQLSRQWAEAQEKYEAELRSQAVTHQAALAAIKCQFQEQIAEMNVRFDAQSAMLKSLQKKLVKQADKQTEHMAELLELVRKR